MAKVLQNGNLKLVIQIGLFAITLATIAIATGKILANVDHIQSEVTRIDTMGCAPSHDVRVKISALETTLTSQKQQLTRMEKKLDDIDQYLRSQVR